MDRHLRTEPRRLLALTANRKRLIPPCRSIFFSLFLSSFSLQVTASVPLHFPLSPSSPFSIYISLFFQLLVLHPPTFRLSSLSHHTAILPPSRKINMEWRWYTTLVAAAACCSPLLSLGCRRRFLLRVSSPYPLFRRSFHHSIHPPSVAFFPSLSVF